MEEEEMDFENFNKIFVVIKVILEVALKSQVSILVKINSEIFMETQIIIVVINLDQIQMTKEDSIQRMHKDVFT